MEGDASARHPPGTANQWAGGFVENATVTASGTTTGWRVTIALLSGAAVTGAWNARVIGTTGTVTATNAGYNGNAAGVGATFGFQGTGTATGISFTCKAS